MPLPEDFFDSPIDTTTYTGTRNIFPDFGEEDVEEKGSAYDAIGQFLWSTGAHFVSGGTLGFTEFFAPTKAWEEKTTAERMGAAVGEALGFFVPMAAIGKGVRGTMALAKGGSKGIAKAAIDKSVSSIGDAALKTAAAKGLAKGVFSKEGKRLLYQHELGGEVLERVNRNLMTNTEAALRAGVKKAGLEADDATINTVMKSLQEGLQEGKHINSVSSWLHAKIAPKVGAGKASQWLAKYAGEVAQDMVVLGIQGVASNAMHSAARGDIDFAPGSALGHALMLSVAFPAIRSFGGGGERRIGELWGIMVAKHGKTDYTKLAAGPDAANNLRGLLRIITGGKRKNLLGKTEWTGKSGNKYHVDDFANLNFKNKEVFDDAVDILKQIQGSIGKLDGAKIWGKAYARDTLKPGTIGRIVTGAAVMNLDMFRDNAHMFRNLPPEEVLTHLLIGGMMSRGKGGWARDPKSRTGDAKAEQINDYYQLMHLLGIDHSKVSDYVKVKNFQDVVMGNHMGLVFDPTATEIERIFKKYEKLIATDEKYKYDRTEKSSKEINDPVEEWKLLRDAVGLMREEGYDGVNYNILTPEDKTSLREELRKVVYKDKTLKDVSYNKFMQDFSLEQAKTSGTTYIDFLNRLGRESYEGADDKILDGFIDNQGKLNHGGIVWEHESSDIAELRDLLYVLESNQMAVKISGEQFKTTDFDKNPKALARLERVSKEFREQQKQMGLGDGVEFTFNIGNPQENPFLRSWLQSRVMEGQSRIANIVTKTDVKEMDRADSGFMDVIAREFADDDGAILFPTKYRVVNEQGVEVDDLVLQDQIFGIASALYEGAPKTRRFSEKGDQPIPEEIARQIVGAYEDLNLAIPAESLKDPAHLRYIESRAYEKVDKRPENIRVIRKLEEENLAMVDKEEGRVLVNSDAAIRDIASKDLNPAQVEELVAAHREIVGALGNNVEQAPGKIGFPLEPDRIINIESLHAIRKMLPGIFDKEVRTQVTDMWNNPERITRLDSEELEGELDLLSENLKVMNFDAALKNLESLRKRLPGFEETFGKIYDEILLKQQEALPLELEVFELSKGTGNVYRAMQEYIASEKIASQLIEKYLVQLVYRGGDYRSISDYNRLVDNLLVSVGADKEKATLEQLFTTYLQKNSYESLQQLMHGVNQLHAGRKMPNEIDNTHLTDAMEQMFQNYTDTPNKTKISIARDYGLLDVEGNISALTVERLKAGDFESIKKNITPENLTTRVDEDLFWLSEIIRNSREQKMVRLTEIIDENGKSVMVREWVMPWDNVEFNTPANRVLDSFNEGGVEVYPISKSGIIDGWQQQEISFDLNAKALFENNNTQDMPETKYLTDIIKKDGRLTHEDVIARDIEMPTGPMKFVEVSLGRPLLLVENEASIEALNTMYRDWYSITRNRFRDQSPEQRNFERAFDPEKVVDNEVKLRALYSYRLNPDAFNKLWTIESIEAMSEAHGLYGLSNKLVKYSKLAEGGSLKPLPSAERLQLLIDNLPDIPEHRRTSIENLIAEITENEQGITSAFYADEVEGMENPLSVRTRHIAQLDNIQDPVLREHLRQRYASGEESRFKSVMDVSSIDGAQYIDGDMRNLLLTVVAEADHVNGFKGSIAKSGSQDLITLYGKGLFIYDPVIAASMEAKGVRILMGESAAKNYVGNSLSGELVSGRVAQSLDLTADIGNLSNDNIMRIPLESIGIRYGGHLSNNSPVPHPYTHYMPENLVLAVRDGWQMLGTKIGEIKRFGRALNMAANEELAMAIKLQRETQGYMHEMDAVSFAEFMLNLGGTTRNPVIREAVMKMWEENALPILLKPRNPKFTYPFLVPDLNSAHPVGIDVYKRDGLFGTGEIGSPNGHVRIQLGEGVLGEDAKHVPVGSINELAFSFRANDIDYLIKYNNKKDKFFIYTPAKEYSDAGHRFDISTQQGERGELTFTEEIPSEIQSFIRHLGDIISRGVAPESTVVGSKTRRPSLSGIQNYIEDVINNRANEFYKKILVDQKFNLVHMVERGPRKGMSDFVPVRLRIRSQSEKDAGGIGTALGVNALDVRANAQGDHDGDKGRTTHDFSPYGPKGTEGKWEYLKNAYKLSGNNEEYTTLEAGTRPLNLFGIGVDNKGDLTHAGSRTNDNIYEYKAKMLADQRAVGKIIGLQGAIEWGSLGGLSIDGVRLNDKLGYDVDRLLDYGDIYRRFEKGNQSAVDFISALDKILIDKPYSYMLNGEGEPILKGKLMELPDESVQMDILYEVINILRSPNSIFNQEFSEMGSKNATAYDIHSHYTDILKFFHSPNQTVFNRLLKKYRRGDVSFEQKLNELVPLFFKTDDGKDVMVSNMADLKSKILQGKVFPNRNVIKFEEKDITELMRKSNVGFVMDEIVKNSMFKSQEMDLAWAHVDGISQFKKGSELFVDEITMLKVLGISQDQILENSQSAFTIGRQKWLQNAEKATLLYDLLGNEESFLTGKLEYQLGFGKHANKEVVRGLVDRLDSVAAARNVIEVFRKEDILKTISDRQDSRIKKFTKKAGSIRNNDKKPKVIYKIVDSLHIKDMDGKSKPNWKALKYVDTIQPGRSSKKLRGDYLVLDNPLVGHRLSRESTLDGLAWNFTHNSLPQFVNKTAFDRYEREATRVAIELKEIWRKALVDFRNNKGFIGNIFSRAERNKLMMLNNYFKHTKFTKETELAISDQHLIGDLGEEGSLVYYKAKMLLRPDVIANHYIEGQVELPYMALSDKIFKEVFSWLQNNNQKEVASRLLKEYTDIKNYLSGFTNESTFDLHPSPLYRTKYNIDMDKANSAVLSVLEGVITPDLQVRLKQKGIGTFEGDAIYSKKGEGGYEIREIRDIFSNWKEGKVDKRISCRP
jgi:hypothetical protein